MYLLGFSDSSGQNATNLKLARERADVVARQLTMRGVTVASTLALGEEMPVATNDTPAGRDKNRRVEIWLQAGGGISSL